MRIALDHSAGWIRRARRDAVAGKGRAVEPERVAVIGAQDDGPIGRHLIEARLARPVDQLFVGEARDVPACAAHLVGLGMLPDKPPHRPQAGIR